MTTYGSTNESNDAIEETMANGNSIEIVGLNGTKISCNKVSDEYGSRIQFSLSGKIKKNKSRIIGCMTVDAASNKRFLKAPSLRKSTANRNSNSPNSMTTRLRSIERDSDGNIVKYKYDLIYKAKSNKISSNNVGYSVTNISNLPSVKTHVVGIDSVDVGGLTMSSGRQSKNITIKGAKGASCLVVVTTFIDAVDSNGDIVSSVEENATNSDVTNYTYNSPIGDIQVVNAEIGASGKFTFKQQYPAVTKNTRHNVHVLPSLLGSRWNSDSWKNDWPRDSKTGRVFFNKEILQYVKPKLTFSATISNVGTGGARTVSLNGISMTGSNSITRYYTGNYDKGKDSSRVEKPLTVMETTPQLNGGSNLEYITVRYVVLADHAISADRAAKFNSSVNGTSDWTNSVSSENGGCKLTLMEPALPILTANGGVANGTATIYLRFRVENYGTKPTTMHIDLNNLITIG